MKVWNNLWRTNNSKDCCKLLYVW